MADLLRIETLTRERAEEMVPELLDMARDLAWEYWGPEHLLSPRSEKWERSLLATRGGRPVAWAVVSRTRDGAHLHHIVIARDERSAGVGTRLMAELLRRTSPGTLTLKVPRGNESAARFYAGLGFIEQPPSPSGYRVFSRSTTDVQEAPT